MVIEEDIRGAIEIEKGILLFYFRTFILDQ